MLVNRQVHVFTFFSVLAHFLKRTTMKQLCLLLCYQNLYFLLFYHPCKTNKVIRKESISCHSLTYEVRIIVKCNHIYAAR